jgi:HlyD family secretion protein
VGGTVLELAVNEGSRVERGQLIAKLDTRSAELQLARARTDLDQAEAQLHLVQAPARTEDEAQAKAQVAVVDAELTALATERVAAVADLARFESLLQNKAGTTKARDDADVRVKLVDDRAAAARERRAAAQATLDRVRAGARRQEVDVARTRVDAARALMATLDKAIADATIVSPITGTVAQTLAERGEMVAPRMPVVLVVDLAHAWATVYVEEPDVPRITVGQTATVTTDAPGQRLEGTVSYISPQAEFTPRNVQTADERAKLVYRVRIAVDNSAGILKPGMPVLADLPYGTTAATQGH